MKRGVPICEWDLPPDFYRWLSLRLAQLVIKDKYIYNKGDIRKGTTMQHITIIQ
jgi:hypothetical protein